MTPAPKKSAGFTLLELVLVMLILTILVGLVAPSLRGFATGRKTTDAAAQLVAVARWARTQAITESTTYHLNLDPAAGTYWVTVLDVAGADQRIQTSLGQIYRVPEGVTLESDLPTDQGHQTINFYATGRADPGTIRLRGERQEIQVVCLSATEGYHVAAPREGAQP
jgi:prepilin-type N-terminal cleavage/methylation domain-containing protein